ncbi:MAG: hypothetical protein JWP44_4456 [Mucilaginibacter sp.]|nr:hypothetical protein [Mucilaginibacter sp.]
MPSSGGTFDPQHLAGFGRRTPEMSRFFNSARIAILLRRSPLTARRHPTSPQRADVPRVSHWQLMGHLATPSKNNRLRSARRYARTLNGASKRLF